MDDDYPLPVIIMPEYVYFRPQKYGSLMAYHCERCKEWFDDVRWAYRGIYHHLQSKRHADRMALHEANFCKTCNIQFPCAAKMKSHKESRKHLELESGETPVTYCEICDKKFPCFAKYKTHITSSSHARKLAPPPQRSCDVCGIKVTTDKQMETHLATKKHQRKTLLSSPPLLETTSSEQ